MPTRRSALAGALTLVAVCLLSGCDEQPPVTAQAVPETSATESPPTPTPPPKPDPPPPADACYRLGSEGAQKSHSSAEPVSCAARHTSETIAVEKLPKPVYGSRQQPHPAAIAKYATRRCEWLFVDHVGGGIADRVLSRLATVWFVPSDEDLAAGARWLRCDVVAYGTDESLARLTGPTEGVLDSDGALDEYGLCSQGDPSDAESEDVMCRLGHSWRAFETIRLGPAKAAWPGRSTVADDTRCSQDARDYLGLPLEWQFGWQPPTKQQWKAGRRWGLCWAPD